MTGMNQELENAKPLLNKRNKAIRFADESPAGWCTVEEYVSDDLPDNSEDNKQLRSAERGALTKIRSKKQNRNFSQSRTKFSHKSLSSTGALSSNILLRQATTAFRQMLCLWSIRALGQFTFLSSFRSLRQQSLAQQLLRFCH